MCLAVVNSNVEKIRGIKYIRGYKNFSVNEDLYNGKTPNGLRSVRGVIFRPGRTSHCTQTGTIPSGDSVITSYPKGIHSFLNEADAKNYASGVVLEVLIPLDTIVSIGKQQCYDTGSTVVSKTIKIPLSLYNKKALKERKIKYPGQKVDDARKSKIKAKR